MFRPWIHVAVPPGWPSTALRWGLVLATLLMLIPVLLARVPASWPVGREVGWVLRIVGVAAMLWSMAWVRDLLQTRLPHAAYAMGTALVFSERGRKRKVKLDRVVDIDVVLRPVPDIQVAVIELTDGRVRELCPLHWRGAGPLYREVRRRIDRRARANARAQRRLAHRSRAQRWHPPSESGPPQG